VRRSACSFPAKWECASTTASRRPSVLQAPPLVRWWGSEHHCGACALSESGALDRHLSDPNSWR
jgi:hypothetical protein